MELVELLETGSQGEVAVVKSLLEAEGIPYFVQGENFQAVRPLVGVARIMVPEDRLADAEALIQNLDS